MPLDNKWMDLVVFFEYHAFDLDEIRREQNSKSATIHLNFIRFCRMFLYLNRHEKQTVNLNPDQVPVKQFYLDTFCRLARFS